MKSPNSTRLPQLRRALIAIPVAALLTACAQQPDGRLLASPDAGTVRTPYVSTTPAMICRGCEMR